MKTTVKCSLRSLEQDPAFEAEVEDCIYFKLCIGLISMCSFIVLWLKPSSKCLSNL